MTALTFPLSLAQFYDKLKVSSVTFDLPERLEVSGLASGEVLSADLGPMLWKGEVTLGALTRAEIAEVTALVNLLRAPGRSFFAYDTVKAYPQLDPTGSILGASAPTIHTLDANNREMRIQALPNGYTLKAGDYLSFAYSSSPTRYALHMLVTDAVAAVGGITPLFEVVPPIRPGAAVSAAITLKKPNCKAIILPGSVQPGSTQRGINRGFGFSITQTLR